MLADAARGISGSTVVAAAAESFSGTEMSTERLAGIEWLS